MKNIKDRLNEYASEKNAKTARQDTNLVAFLAIKDEVEEALEMGYTIKLIWEFFYYKEKKIKTSYDIFRKYTAKHLRNVRNDKVGKKTIGENKTKSVQGGQHPMKTDKAEGFTFNPVPNVEDLI